MNIDFSSHPGFSLYVVLLAGSGVLMVGIGATAFSRLSTGWRVFNLIAGVAFFGYAFYLAFLFHGGTYIVFFKAFILPVLMVINAIRSAMTRRKSQVPPQNGWVAPQQGWNGPPQGWNGPQQGWTAPPQGWTAPPQGWPAPQPGPQQAGELGPQQPGWAAPQQPGQAGPQQSGWPGPQ